VLRDIIRSQATDLKVTNFVNIVTLQVPAHRTNTVTNFMHSHYTRGSQKVPGNVV